MDDAHHEPDAPTADPARAAQAETGGSDSEDEAAPDFGQLAALASRAMARQGGLSSGDDAGTSSASAADIRSSGAVFIPKRGEKDFEPTGFAAQSRALENSRKAMFDVISCQRVVNSKTISIATWEPTIKRAVVHLARGQAFTSMGQSRRVALLEDGQYEDLAQARAAAARMTTTTVTLAPRAGTIKDGVFWPKLQSRLELLPEETLYLIERGSLECRVAHDPKQQSQSATIVHDYDNESEQEDWLPMSVEQAFATLIGVDGLTRPRYQLYAYLRRLGYIVQRKSVSDALRTSNVASSKTASSTAITGGGESVSEVHAEGVIHDPKRPLRFVTIFDVLLYPLRRIAQIIGQGAAQVQAALLRLAEWLRGVVRRASTSLHVSKKNAVQPSIRSPGLLGIGAGAWSNYDEIFDRLRIVPTGHDAPLPLHTQASIGTAKTRTMDSAPEIFFYAWRPATLFKKSEPPLPEFQLAVVDARHTGLPSAFAFAELFQYVPVPLSALDLEGLDEDEQREVKKAQEQRKRNDESYGRGAVRKRQAAEREAKATKHAATHGISREGVQRQTGISSAIRAMLQRFVRLFSFLSAYLSHLPPGCYVPNRPGRGRHARTGGAAHQSGTSSTNVYGPLKSGRRNVIVAVNDCGTSSLLRFGEAEFARWRIAGTDKQGR